MNRSQIRRISCVVFVLAFAVSMSACDNTPPAQSASEYSYNNTVDYSRPDVASSEGIGPGGTDSSRSSPPRSSGTTGKSSRPSSSSGSKGDGYVELTDPNSLLKDTAFAAGYRADWQLGETYSGASAQRKGEVLTYRDISPYTINHIGGQSDRGKYWEILTEDHLNKYLYIREYHFNTGVDGFTASNASIKARASSLFIKPDVPGAYIQTPSFELAASQALYIRFRLRNPTKSAAVKLMWITEADKSWNAAKTVEVEIIPGDTTKRSQSYVANMKGKWSGTIKQVRLVFDTTITSSKEIDQLELEYLNFAKGFDDRYWGNKLNVNPVEVVDTADQLKVTKYNMEKTDYKNYKMAEVTSNKKGTLTIWNRSGNHPYISDNTFYNNPEMECWPAMYLFQNFKKQVPLADFDKVNVSFDITLEKVNLVSDVRQNRKVLDTNGFGEVTLNNEAGLTVQVYYRNKYDQSKALYTMLRLYSSENSYFEHADGDYFGAIFSWPEQKPGDGTYGEFPLTIGKKATVSFEAKALLSKCISIAQKKFPQLSSAADDYLIDGFYLGWEYLGDFETQFTVSNISAKGTTNVKTAKAWDFSKNSDKFTCISPNTVSIQQGALNYRFTKEGTLYSPSGLDISASGNNLIRLYARSDSQADVILGELLFKKKNGNDWSAASIPFRILGNNREGYTEYVISLRGIPGWDGTIDQLRFDFTGPDKETTRIQFDRVLIHSD